MSRFLNYNVDWLQSCLGIQSVGTHTGLSEGTIPALIKPWGSEIFPPQSPFDMMNQIGGCSQNSNLRDLEYAEANVPFLSVSMSHRKSLSNANVINHNNNNLKRSSILDRFGTDLLHDRNQDVGLVEGDWELSFVLHVCYLHCH